MFYLVVYIELLLHNLCISVITNFAPNKSDLSFYVDVFLFDVFLSIFEAFIYRPEMYWEILM